MKQVRLELSSGIYAMVGVYKTDEDDENIEELTLSEQKEYWNSRALEYLENSIDDFKSRNNLCED